MNCADIRISRYIPCAGQGSCIGRFGFHRNSSRCAESRNAAGITVCKPFGCIASGSCKLQISQFCSRAVRTAFGRNYTVVVTFRPGIPGPDRRNKAYRSITQNRLSAGIVLGNEGEVRIGSGNRYFLFLTLFVFRLFRLFRLIAYVSHVHFGSSFGDGLGLIGIHRNTYSHVGTVRFRMCHVFAFFTHNRPGQHSVTEELVAVFHCNVRLGFGRSVAVHHRNAYQ